MEEQTRRMLNTIRLLKEEQNTTNKDLVLTKNTPNFGDIRPSHEELLTKTIGEMIEFSDDALIYKTKDKSLELTGKIQSLNLVFLFRFPDPNGDGCYITTNGLQLTEPNQNTIGKIRDAFDIWRHKLTENSDLLNKIYKAATDNRI